LIEELTVPIFVFDDAERLFVVHFMLLDLLYLEFFVFMEDVSFEVGFVFLKILGRCSIMKVGWDKLIEVFYMHKLWVYLFKHAFIESLF